MTKKFRFYDKEYKQWRELPDLFGDYQAHAFRTYGEGFELRHFLNTDAQEKILSGDLVVQQWTGLLDKTGREIYEGDIIQTFLENGKKQFKAAIKYDERCGGYSFYIPGYSAYRHDCHFFDSPLEKPSYGRSGMISSNRFEIIGNIFENPLDNRPTKD